MVNLLLSQAGSVTMTWRDIADDLVRRIADGDPPDGDHLVFADLEERYGISRSTTQRVMSRVGDLGYAEWKPGKGWFATKP